MEFPIDRNATHVISEDYDSYQNRKRKEFNRQANFGIFLIVIIIVGLGIYQIHSSIQRNEQQKAMDDYLNDPTALYCGMTHNAILNLFGNPTRTEAGSIVNEGNPTYYWDYEDTKQSIIVSENGAGIVVGIDVRPFPSVRVDDVQSVLRCMYTNGRWTTTYVNTEIIKYK